MPPIATATTTSSAAASNDIAEPESELLQTPPPKSKTATTTTTPTPISSEATSPSPSNTLTAPGILVSLSSDPLDTLSILHSVRHPASGANVLFTGTTRSPSKVPSSSNKDEPPAILPVKSLTYTTYPALALRTMLSIAQDVKTKYGLSGLSVVHRTGEVAVGEESIVIAVACGHRTEAWRAGEELLERVKERVEVWKWEVFDTDGEQKLEDGGNGADLNGWRANNG